jgi:hypothetical protein
VQWQISPSLGLACPPPSSPSPSLAFPESSDWERSHRVEIFRSCAFYIHSEFFFILSESG